MIYLGHVGAVTFRDRSVIRVMENFTESNFAEDSTFLSIASNCHLKLILLPLNAQLNNLCAIMQLFEREFSKPLPFLPLHRKHVRNM